MQNIIIKLSVERSVDKYEGLIIRVSKDENLAPRFQQFFILKTIRYFSILI